MTELPDSSDEKLQKVLARAGLGSRRDMERLIGANRVTVNGRIAHVGDRVGERDRILVDGHPVALKSSEERRTRVLIYNKPEGEICSVRDPEGRPTVFERLPTLRGERWISVGRLDYNTSGLLLFTTDGELANGLMHPSASIDREYLCRVMGEVNDDMLKRLRSGVLLEDGMARFTDISAGGGNDESINRWFYVCLMEGRNREVRRLWESQDIKVNRLKRVRFGPVFLPGRLKQGQWIDMSLEEVQALYRLVNLEPPTLTPFSPQERKDRDRELRKNRPVQRGGDKVERVTRSDGARRGYPEARFDGERRAERKSPERKSSERTGSERRGPERKGSEGRPQERSGRGGGRIFSSDKPRGDKPRRGPK